MAHAPRLRAGLHATVIVALALALPATAVGRPSISGADNDVWNVARPRPNYVITGSAPGAALTWSVGNAASGAGTSPLTVTLLGLPDGEHKLEARQTLGSDRSRASRGFRLDTTPATIDLRSPTDGAAVGVGARVIVDFSCQGATSCVGSVPDGDELDTSVPRTGQVEVTAVDDAGNLTRRSASFTVSAPASPVVVLPPPPPPTIATGPPGATDNPNPRFSWIPGEPEGTFQWEVLGAGGTVTTSGETPSAEASVGPLVPGAYAFHVRQRRADGVSGPFSAPEPFTITPLPAPPATPSTTTPTARVPTLNAKRLHPAAGARLTTRRPLLRWPRRAGARFYNLQIFRTTSTGSYVKVLFTFPRRTSFRPRAGALTPGVRYIWRVWPWVRGRFTESPLGVSWFEVRRPG